MFVSGRALEGVVAFHQSKRNSISRKCHPKPRKPGNCFHRRFGEVGNTGVSWARTARECLWIAGASVVPPGPVHSWRWLLSRDEVGMRFFLSKLYQFA